MPRSPSRKLNGGEASATPMTSAPRAFTSSSLSAMAGESADRATAVAKSTVATLPPVGGEGRPRERSERGRGGGATLAPSMVVENVSCMEQAAPPTPDPSPPLASLAGGGEKRRVIASLLAGILR